MQDDYWGHHVGPGFGLLLPGVLPKAVPVVLKMDLSAGALGGIRTPDPQIRSLVLYPAELRAPGTF